MTIDRILVRGRSKVAWLDTAVPEEAKAVFEKREHAVEQCTAAQLAEPAYLAGIGAVVLTGNPTDSVPLRRQLTDHARTLLAYDCRVIVITALDDATRKSLIATVGRLQLPNARLVSTDDKETFKGFQDPEGDPPLPHVRFYAPSTPWETIANFVAYHPAGKTPDPTVVIVPEDSFEEFDRLLLRRAFAGCAEVHLAPMEGGRSGANVYRAQARIDGFSGGWTQPYFVKTGKRKAIVKEFVNYEEKVDPYVPFHLGPNLLRDRCCLDAMRGVIVGDYVEESESLKQCASGGRAAQAIACLFDRTLRGWYRNSEPDNRLLMDIVYLPKDYPEAVIKTAREIGAKFDSKAFTEHFARCTDKPWLSGPVHGDLHATNVRVRATEAIVIDFGAHRDDLVLRDIARLEVSLLVDGFEGAPYENMMDRAKYKGKDWLESVEKLYHVNPTANDPRPHEDPKSPSYWFHTCVRQIRLHARQFERGRAQYAAALALELLIKSSRDDEVLPFESYRRAAAFYLAEQLLLSVFPAVAVAKTA